jgi:hypothetical protein
MKIQSLCADIAKLGFCELVNVERLPQVLFVHDDNKLEWDSLEQAKAHEPLIRECMVDRPLATLRREFGVHIDVPIEVGFSYKVAH